jgi:hypothetical protein
MAAWVITRSSARRPLRAANEPPGELAVVPRAPALASGQHPRRHTAAAPIHGRLRRVPGEPGGIVRLPEIAEIVRVPRPVHVAFGPRNAPDLLRPSGSRVERVRSGARGVELLRRADGRGRPWRSGHRGWRCRRPSCRHATDRVLDERFEPWLPRVLWRRTRGARDKRATFASRMGRRGFDGPARARVSAGAHGEEHEP